MNCPKCGEPYPGQQVWVNPVNAAVAAPYTWQVVPTHAANAPICNPPPEFSSTTGGK